MENQNNTLMSFVKSWSHTTFSTIMISEKNSKYQQNFCFRFPWNIEHDEASGYTFHEQTICTNLKNLVHLKNSSYFSSKGPHIQEISVDVF